MPAKMKKPRRSGAVRDIGGDRTAALKLTNRTEHGASWLTRPYDAAARFSRMHGDGR
jgi:hypothetical protein